MGQDKASPESFLAALFLARETYLNRERYEEDTANPLEDRMHLVYKRKSRSAKSKPKGSGRGKGGGKR